MRIGGALVLVSLLASSAYGQCGGYPAPKTYVATFPGPQLTSANGAFPGWELESGGGGGTVIMTILGDPGKPCQRDTTPGGVKRKYRSDRWTVPAGQELSISWHVYVVNSTRLPAVKLRNGSRALRLDFYGNVLGQGKTSCAPSEAYSGWRVAEGSPSVLTGGREVLNNNRDAVRYLPMGMNGWHTIRVDLHPNGSFDAWIDPEAGIASSHQHLSGTLTTATSNTYVQFGKTESDGSYSAEYATHCVAWGAGSEVPPAPTGGADCDANPGEAACQYPENTPALCGNGIDDDGDGLIDCADADCAAFNHCAADAVEYVVTSVRQMGHGTGTNPGEAPGGQNNIYFSVYDENGNSVPNVTIRDPRSCNIVPGPHADNGQLGHYRYIQLNVDGQKSYRFYVASDSTGLVSSEVTPELYQTLPDIGFAWLVEFMRKSKRSNPGLFKPTELVYEYHGIVMNQFNESNPSLTNDQCNLGAGSDVWVQTFRVPAGVSRIVSARFMPQIGYGNGSFQYRLTIHPVIGNNPPQTLADLGLQIGAAKDSPLITQDSGAWMDQMVLWPTTGPGAAIVNPGEFYAIKIVRVDGGSGAPSLTMARSLSNWTTDVFGGKDRIAGLRLDAGQLVLDPSFFDIRGYVVGGRFSPCTDPVFDVRTTLGQPGADGLIQAQDLVAFVDCATGAAIGDELFQNMSQECRCMDVDQDSDIDMADFAVLQRCFTGDNGSLDINCDNVP